jgi:hypothetical protein
VDPLSRQILEAIDVDPIAPRPRRQLSLADHWTPPVLLERAEYLRKLARAGTGSATEVLRHAPEYSAVLSFQSRSGEPEIDLKFAKILYVLAGGATLLLRGMTPGAHPVAPGDSPADQIQNLVRQELRTGDVVHLPVGTGHQIVVPGDKTITCLIVKIQAIV